MQAMQRRRHHLAIRRTASASAEAAVVGIGTMILFIATILVASIAAGVLIDMSRGLSDQGESTGRQATQDVSSSLRIESVVGLRNTTAQTDLVYLNIYVKPAAGAPAIDLAQMRLEILHSDDIVVLNYSEAAAAPSGQYIATAVRDDDGSFSTSDPIITEGDLVRLNVTATSNSISLPPRAEITIGLIPERGSRVEQAYVTPETYGVKTLVALR